MLSDSSQALRPWIATLFGAAFLTPSLPAQSQSAEGTAAKVVVVIAGDADSALRTEALAWEEQLQEAGLRLPEDPAIRGALRGEVGASSDGLDGARSLRRGLGWAPEGLSADRGALGQVGRLTGADLVLILHGGNPSELFDVRARAFFETLPSEGQLRYVVRAAQAAQRRGHRRSPPARASSEEDRNRAEDDARNPSAQLSGEHPSSRRHGSASPVVQGSEEGPDAGSSSPETASDSAVTNASEGPLPQSAPSPEEVAAGELGTEETLEPMDSPAVAFFKKSWPYLVAGALLVGAVLYLVLRPSSEPSPPALVFTPPSQ